jgi:hypothetical protein
MVATKITIKVESDLARKAKALAVRHGISLSRLVAEQLETLVQEDQDFAAARQRALRQLKKGFDLGAGKLTGRDDLYDREDLC